MNKTKLAFGLAAAVLLTASCAGTQAPLYKEIATDNKMAINPDCQPNIFNARRFSSEEVRILSTGSMYPTGTRFPQTEYALKRSSSTAQRRLQGLWHAVIKGLHPN